MRVTAQVLDVSQKRHAGVAAEGGSRTTKEEQTLVCSGICRVEDVTPDNTVLSTQLFDLEFSKTNKGQVREHDHEPV